MVSKQPISNESPIQPITMSDQNPTISLNTQPSSATSKQIIAFNITGQINEKLTPSTFLQWRAQFEALLIGYDLLKFVEGTLRCPSSLLHHSFHGSHRDGAQRAQAQQLLRPAQ